MKIHWSKVWANLDNRFLTPSNKLEIQRLVESQLEETEITKLIEENEKIYKDRVKLQIELRSVKEELAKVTKKS